MSDHVYVCLGSKFVPFLRIFILLCIIISLLYISAKLSQKKNQKKNQEINFNTCLTSNIFHGYNYIKEKICIVKLSIAKTDATCLHVLVSDIERR